MTAPRPSQSSGPSSAAATASTRNSAPHTPWSRSWPTTSAPARSGSGISTAGSRITSRCCDNPSLVNSNLDLFLKLLRTVKRRSSWLDAILICLTGEMFLYSGMAVRDHTQEVHVMGSDEIHIYHAAVVHDNNRETVSIGTDAAVISD